MMSKSEQAASQQADIEVLGKTFQIKCSQDKVAALHEAAQRLNQEMQAMRRNGVVGMERIAIIAALNLAGLVNQLENNVNSNVNNFNGRIVEIQKRIDEALTQAEQLEL